MTNYITRSLRIKLMILFLVVSIVPVGIVGYISYDNARAALEKQALASLEAVTNSRVSDITHLIQLRHEQAKELAGTFLPRQLESSGVNDPEDIAKIQVHIESILEEMKLPPKSGYGDIDKATAIEIIGIWDTKGTIVANTNKELVGKKMPDHYLQAVKSKGTFFGGFKTDPLTGEDFLIFLQAIRDFEDAKFAGAVLFKVKAQILNDITTDKAGLGETGEILLGQKEGDKVKFITQLRHTNDPPTVILGSNQALPVQESVQGKGGKGLSIDYRKEEILAVWKHLPSMEWGIVGKIDTKEAFALATALRTRVFLVSLIIGILVVLASVAFSRGVTKPIRRLVYAAGIVAKGDLTAEVKIKSRDELGNLAGSFNQMVVDLKKLSEAERKKTDELHDEITKRKKAVEMLKAVNQQLQASEQHLKASNQQLRASEQQLKASNQQLRASEQHLKASNQQLRASEQHLKASNQQLRASEQQLKSSNQQLRVNERQLRAEITERKKMEEQTKKHLRELEVFYKANIGREERIVELKKGIKVLEAKLYEEKL